MDNSGDLNYNYSLLNFRSNAKHHDREHEAPRQEHINGVEVEVLIAMGLTNPYRIDGGNVITNGAGESTINMAIIVGRLLTAQAKTVFSPLLWPFLPLYRCRSPLTL